MAGHYGGNPYAWRGGANAPHITRYFLARGWVFPGETVLDAGCGTGYGTMMLSDIVGPEGKAIGVEVDEGCVVQANNQHKRDNNEFHVVNLNTDEIPEADVCVSIECVEHLDDMHHFLDEATKKIKRAFIITVPLGGTSHAYVNEPPGPATEKNDFANGAAVDKLFDERGWKKQTSFQFGYSHFGVYFKEEPKDPRDEKNNS